VFSARGTLSIRRLCMPAATNQYADIFAASLLGQMQIAGGICVSKTRPVAAPLSQSMP